MTYAKQYTTRKPLHPSSDYNLCKFAFARVTLVILIHSGGSRGGARGPGGPAPPLICGPN